MIGLDFGFKLARHSAGSTLLVLVAATTVARSEAQTSYSLTHNNSTVQINVSPSGPNTPGMASWLVDGVNQVNQQWFYYRLGSGGLSFSGAALPIESLSGGSPTSVVQSDPSRLSLVYANAACSVQVDYTLVGLTPGSAGAKLAETVTFRNLTSSTLYLQFFEYSDYNLAGTPGGQSGQFAANAAGNTFSQSLGAATLSDKWVANTLLGGHVSHFQTAMLGTGLLAGLQNGTLISLNDTAASGSGDVTGAVEWDVALAPNGSDTASFLTLSETINLQNVPEPSALALLGLGLLLGARHCHPTWRRNKH